MWRKTKYYLSKCLIKMFGDVQFFPAPMFCLFWGNTHYKVKGEEARVILSKLQRGDILLTRFDRYVSSWCIPGYYTHVILYIGNDRVVHAVTKGVLEEDVLCVLRADHICVLRPQGVDAMNIQVATNMAHTLVGRDYDFLFESNDDESLYCSELAKRVYPGLFQKLGDESAIAPDEYRTHPRVKIIHESKIWREEKNAEITLV